MVLTGLEGLLARTCGSAVALADVETLAYLRGAVLRVTIDPPVPGIGRTVIVKRRDPDNEIGSFAATNLATERAALDLLTRQGADVAPRLIAADEQLGMIVMTDAGRSVESIIFSGNRADATAALVSLGETTGRLHRVPPDGEPFVGLETWTIGSREQGWDALPRDLLAARLPLPPPAAHAEYRDLLAELRDPQRTTVLVHGDLGPNNAVIDENRVCRLVDFEGSGLQHLGVDAAMLRFPFAWYGRWALVPDEVQHAMEMAYREALGWPDEVVDDAIAVGAMAMAVLRLERIPRIADCSQSPELALRRRTQIVSTLEVATEATREVARFAALRDWLKELVAGMRDLWPEAGEPVSPYPAFRSE